MDYDAVYGKSTFIAFFYRLFNTEVLLNKQFLYISYCRKLIGKENQDTVDLI